MRILKISIFSEYFWIFFYSSKNIIKAPGGFYNTRALQRTSNQGHRMLKKKERNENSDVCKFHFQRRIRAVLTQTSLFGWKKLLYLRGRGLVLRSQNGWILVDNFTEEMNTSHHKKTMAKLFFLMWDSAFQDLGRGICRSSSGGVVGG